MTTKTLSTVIVAALLAGSAMAGMQVAASQTPAPILATDAVVLIGPAAPRFVPTTSGLKVAPSPVVRIAP
jgi:hypothetical protein